MAANPLPPDPIPTTYHGITFRSKLEAQWAFALDRLQVPWEYEPEARRTSRGGYLPDFFLPRMKGGTWLEVKPFGLLGLEDPRWHEYAQQVGQRLIVAFGLRDPYAGIGPESQGVCAAIHPAGMDTDYHLTRCLVCGEVGIEFEARGARACATLKACYGRLDADRGHNPDDQAILAALIEARGAFSWNPVSARGGRTLSDLQVEHQARELVAWHEENRGGVSKWIQEHVQGEANRTAVLQAWGRITG